MPDIPAPIEPETNSKNGAHRPPEPVVQMTVTLLSDGNVSVSGPLNDFRLCARMLGQALQAAAGFQNKDQPKVMYAPSDALRALRKL
jgi:hypothetical protein